MCNHAKELLNSIHACDIAVLTVCLALLISLLTSTQGLKFLKILKGILRGDK